MTRVHWRSKITVTLQDFSRPPSSTMDNDAYELSSVQSYDPQITTNADVNDSISSERIGYLIRPGRITIAMTVLAAKPTTVGIADVSSNHGFSDSEILSIIQFGRIYFNMVIDHGGPDENQTSNNDFGGSWVWENCIITDSNPSQLTIDGRPTAVFNISALGVTHNLSSTDEVVF